MILFQPSQVLSTAQNRLLQVESLGSVVVYLFGWDEISFIHMMFYFYSPIIYSERLSFEEPGVAI